MILKKIQRWLKSAPKPFEDYLKEDIFSILDECCVIVLNSDQLPARSPVLIRDVANETIEAAAEWLLSYARYLKAGNEFLHLQRFEDVNYIRRQLLPSRRMLNFAIERYHREYRIAVSAKSTEMARKAFRKLIPDIEEFGEKLCRRAMVTKESITVAYMDAL